MLSARIKPQQVSATVSCCGLCCRFTLLCLLAIAAGVNNVLVSTQTGVNFYCNYDEYDEYCRIEVDSNDIAYGAVSAVAFNEFENSDSVLDYAEACGDNSNGIYCAMLGCGILWIILVIISMSTGLVYAIEGVTDACTPNCCACWSKKMSLVCCLTSSITLFVACIDVVILRAVSPQAFVEYDKYSTFYGYSIFYLGASWYLAIISSVGYAIASVRLWADRRLERATSIGGGTSVLAMNNSGPSTGLLANAQQRVGRAAGRARVQPEVVQAQPEKPVNVPAEIMALALEFDIDADKRRLLKRFVKNLQRDELQLTRNNKRKSDKEFEVKFLSNINHLSTVLQQINIARERGIDNDKIAASFMEDIDDFIGENDELGSAPLVQEFNIPSGSVGIQ